MHQSMEKKVLEQSEIVKRVTTEMNQYKAHAERKISSMEEQLNVLNEKCTKDHKEQYSKLIVRSTHKLLGLAK